MALASDGALLDYFLDKASLPGEIQLNGINDDNSEWFYLSYEDREKVNMFMPGDLVVVNGCDISDIRIPRITSSFFTAPFTF